MKKISSTLTALTLFFSIPALAANQCPTYTYNNVVAPGNINETDTYAINDKDVIAGDYIDSASVQHGMILENPDSSNAKLITINNSACSSGIVFFGINSADTAVGTCTGKANVSIAFSWTKGKFTGISPPGAASAAAFGLNDNGDVVGTYTDSNGAPHGFVLGGKKYTTLDPPGDSGASSVVAWSINNSNVITIYFQVGSVFSSFSTANGGKTYQPVSYSGAGPLGTAVHGINNHGDIVATYYDSSSGPHGILFHDGLDCLVDEPDANEQSGTRLDGLNDSLVIVGRYGNLSGTFGFWAMPSKE